MAVLIDGTPGEHIPVTDRGLSYGDGLFETVAIRGGKPRLWHYHVERLQAGFVEYVERDAGILLRRLDGTMVGVDLLVGYDTANPMPRSLVLTFEPAYLEPEVMDEMSARLEDLALTIHPHPTLGETMMEAAEAALGHAIHIIQKPARGRGAGASAKP